jgi:hypothetical protein
MKFVKENKWLLGFVVVAALLMLWGIFKNAHANQIVVGTAGIGDECNVHAEDSSHICSLGLTCVPQNDNSEGNGKCQNLNPSVTPTVAPTLTPTPIVECEDCASPTPEPTRAPEPTVVPQSNNSPVGAPQCSDDGVKFAPIITSVSRVDRDTVKVEWSTTDTTNFMVHYGHVGQSLDWNTKVAGQSAELNLVPFAIDVKVCSLSECGLEKCSVTVDP